MGIERLDLAWEMGYSTGSIGVAVYDSYRSFQDDTGSRGAEEMGNTKSLSREMRKGVKRSQRRGLKDIWMNLTKKDRRKFRNSDEKMGLKAFSNSLQPAVEEAAPAKEAAPAPEATEAAE